ncbi:hypothetical protein NC653_002207 [Populus alba x Populus x berolinensis]|uniref:Uncharacterized protein n=1 Tax=Populus alba x Populus x berolinensis TaxID=444605 RepID=A0AAD6RPE2_9ROSI|nr:hypothetical protein NC653_002207 [Populus alba x Populus x berolinensis]
MLDRGRGSGGNGQKPKKKGRRGWGFGFFELQRRKHNHCWRWGRGIDEWDELLVQRRDLSPSWIAAAASNLLLVIEGRRVSDGYRS